MLNDVSSQTEIIVTSMYGFGRHLFPTCLDFDNKAYTARAKSMESVKITEKTMRGMAGSSIMLIWLFVLMLL